MALAAPGSDIDTFLPETELSIMLSKSSNDVKVDLGNLSPKFLEYLYGRNFIELGDDGTPQDIVILPSIASLPHFYQQLFQFFRSYKAAGNPE